MSFLSRRQRASQQDRVSAQSYASVASESSRWGRFFRRRDRDRHSVAAEAPLSLLTLSSHSQSRPPELRRVPQRSFLLSLRAILQGTRDSSELSPRQLVRQDYSAYHTQTPPGPGSAPSRVWNSNGPLPSLRHRGHLTRIQMTSNDKLEAQAYVVDDAHVNTTPRRQTESVELRRRTAEALNPSSTHSLFGPVHDPYSEAVADWNIGHHGQQDTVAASRASLETSQGRQLLPEADRRHSLSHKPDVSDLRSLSTERDRTESNAPDMGFFKRSHDKERKLKSSSGEKPLPAVPNGNSSQRSPAPERPPRPDEVDATPHSAAAEKAEASRPDDSGIHSELGRERGYLVRDAEDAPDLNGIVDLSNTEDTDVAVTYAPAVTHETRYVETHEVVQQQITREIHNHHVYHRVLPVLDFEVLPPRHFIPVEGGGLTEITEDQIPGGPMGQDLQQVIANAISNMMPKAHHPAAPRQFTARKFEGTEGDYKEWVGEDGIKRSEQWWVHPPTLEKESTFRGEARPFYFHSEHDGFRDPVLDGHPMGLRPLHEAPHTKPAPKRFPPPRGASLGKTSAAGAGGAATHTVLPIRATHGNNGDPAGSSSVGVAY